MFTLALGRAGVGVTRVREQDKGRSGLETLPYRINFQRDQLRSMFGAEGVNLSEARLKCPGPGLGRRDPREQGMLTVMGDF